MRKEIDDARVENVVGGTVIISEDYMIVGFTTLGEKYDLQNCSYREALNLIQDLKDSSQGLTNAEFDVLCRDEFEDRGWI